MKTPLLILCAFITASTVNLRAAESLDTILARMDQASETFKGVAANVQMVTFTKVIDDKTTENGTLKMQRQKDKSTRAIIDFTGKNDARTIYFAGSKIRIFFPKLKLYQDYDVGKSDVLNQYLLLGFGSSGKELSQNYDIKAVGGEKIDGQETTKLELIPKSPKIGETLTKVDVWIPLNAAYPVQQQFFKPNGDYFTTTYSEIKLNPSLKGNLELKLPSGATKQGS